MNLFNGYVEKDYGDFINNLAQITIQENVIDPDLYARFNVKRGLRNADNTGVLVGLTNVGDVQAYEIVDNQKLPTEGKLIYRGINLYDFVDGFTKEKRFGFEECTYLLITGKLPTKTELANFNDLLSDYRRLPDNFAEDMILKAPSPEIMNKLQRSVLAMYSYDYNPEDSSVNNTLRQCLHLIAKLPTMAAYAYQTKCHYYDDKSLHIHNPQKGYSTAENLLHMIRSDTKFSQLEAEILDLNLVLHAEHGGGNNSTFTVHVVTSTGTDTYSAMAAGIGSLKGARHGGANLKVMDMMDDIKGHLSDWNDKKEIYNYLKKILNKEAYDRSGLIYGIGHAVYTKSDPRTVLLKAKAEELAYEKGKTKEFDLYKNIENISLEIFEELKKSNGDMCANVDFYSGFVYSMLNIPKELYTPIFAISRVAGWSAHRLEEMLAANKIIRPAYKNVMSINNEISYKPIGER